VLADALGASDCERVHAGLIAQPVNTASSLAYVAAGAWLLWRVRGAHSRRGVRVAYALSVLAVGAGSVDFHGPAWPGARWLHDLGASAPLLLIAASDLAHLRGRPPEQALGTFAAALAATGATLAVAPAAGVPLLVASAGLAATGEALRRRRGGRAVRPRVLALLAVAAAVNLLGRSGGPLCDPDSLVQGHALWHVLTAAALAAWDPPA
jgi:hypothetical protein